MSCQGQWRAGLMIYNIFQCDMRKPNLPVFHVSFVYCQEDYIGAAVTTGQIVFVTVGGSNAGCSRVSVYPRILSSLQNKILQIIDKDHQYAYS